MFSHLLYILIALADGLQFKSLICTDFGKYFLTSIIFFYFLVQSYIFHLTICWRRNTLQLIQIANNNSMIHYDILMYAEGCHQVYHRAIWKAVVRLAVDIFNVAWFLTNGPKLELWVGM